MKKSTVFFKIIVPNYNNEKWLDKCLSSIEKQTFKDYFVVIVDDMSTDKSVEIIKSYKDKFNMKLFELKEKRYNGGARNVAIKYNVSSEYTLFLDSDDWFYKNDILQKIHDLLTNEPVDCLSLPYHILYQTSQADFYWKNGRNDVRTLVFDACGACWTKCIKTNLIQLFPEGTLMEDTVQHINQCNYLKTFATFKEPVVCYNRTNVESLTNPLAKQSIKWKASIFRFVADLMELWCENADCEERRQERLQTAKNEIKEGKYGVF